MNKSINYLAVCFPARAREVSCGHQLSPECPWLTSRGRVWLSNNFNLVIIWLALLEQMLDTFRHICSDKKHIEHTLTLSLLLDDLASFLVCLETAGSALVANINKAIDETFIVFDIMGTGKGQSWNWLAVANNELIA
jgi:hypothetical protein